MTLSKLERHLAEEAISHISDKDNLNYFVRYFKFVHTELLSNDNQKDEILYGLMVDIFREQFPNYFNNTLE